MRNARGRKVPTFALCLAVVASSARTAAPCSEAQLACEGEITTSDATSLAVECTYSAAYFDHERGRIGVSVQGRGCQCLEGAARADVSDAFEIVSARESGSIDCTVRLHVTGFMAEPGGHHGAFATAALDLVQGEYVAQDVDGWDGWWPDLDWTLDLHVTIETNTPFTLSYGLWMSSWESTARSYLDGRVLFLDLPAGARVRSCGGYSVAPVALVNTHWDAIKSLYR